MIAVSFTSLLRDWMAVMEVVIASAKNLLSDMEIIIQSMVSISVMLKSALNT